MNLHHLTDSDLLAVAHAYANDLSYYNAGWDYPDSARKEQAARAKCRRIWLRIDWEIGKRDLHFDRRGYLL